MSRLTRRELLKAGGLSIGAAMLAAAAPATRPFHVAPDAPALQLVRVGSGVSGRRLQVLAALDDTHRVFADGSREFLLWPGDAARLDAAGIDYAVTDADLLGDARPAAGSSVAPQPGERSEYRIYADYEADLRALVDTYGPDGLARLIKLPTTSLVGRDIYGIEIGRDVANRDGRPVIHMDGMHHSREWPAGEMPIMWAHDLLENYGSDAAITNIVDNARTFIVPCVNPDGFVRSRMTPIDDSDNNVPGYALAVGGQEGMWRKNLRSFSDVNVNGGPTNRDNPDAYGIDLNRNYPFLWGDNNGSSGSEVDQTYRGESPYSEPESHNIRDLFLANTPITAITHHTSGRIMLFAWGRNPAQVRSPDYDRMMALGQAMQAFNGYQPKQAYGLYPTSGTSRDWGHAATSTIIYTFEHGTEFHGTYGPTIPSMYAANRGAFVALSQAALDPSSHVVISGRVVNSQGSPVANAAVRLHKSFLTPTANGGPVPEVVDRTIVTGADGRFEIHAPPSTRPFLAEPQFGGPGTEPWEVLASAGTEAPTTATRLVTAGRGDAVDLGDVAV